MNIIKRITRWYANLRHFAQATNEMDEASFAAWAGPYGDGWANTPPQKPNDPYYMHTYKAGQNDRAEEDAYYGGDRAAYYRQQADLEEQERQRWIKERQAAEEEYRRERAEEKDWETIHQPTNATIKELVDQAYCMVYFENDGTGVTETWRRYEDAPDYIRVNHKRKQVKLTWL